MSLAKSASDGCYEAARAAALSGVSKTTVYWWARQGIVLLSVSPVREKLWSYSDLMALRVVSWLRHPKGGGQRR
jgi:phage terminase Nu1 subunit (DNA packaging protein)